MYKFHIYVGLFLDMQMIRHGSITFSEFIISTALIGSLDVSSLQLCDTGHILTTDDGWH